MQSVKLKYGTYESVLQKSFRLIFLDLELPVLSGFDTIAQIHLFYQE